MRIYNKNESYSQLDSKTDKIKIKIDLSNVYGWLLVLE